MGRQRRKIGVPGRAVRRFEGRLPSDMNRLAAGLVIGIACDANDSPAVSAQTGCARTWAPAHEILSWSTLLHGRPFEELADDSHHETLLGYRSALHGPSRRPARRLPKAPNWTHGSRGSVAG